MAMVEWYIKGKEFANCNCAYGCGCQFNALPTHGFCCAAVGFQFDEGRFGSVKLGGTRAAGLYSWPGPVHEGKGTMQLIVDEKASAEQRDALIKIMTGQDTNEMATMWWVYAAMSPTRLETLFLPIDFAVDVDGRKGHLKINGVVETHGEPIKNPITGADHRARIDLPNGFEYRLAEIGSGTTRTSGKIKLEMTNTYGQFANLHLSHAGVLG